MAKVEGSGSFWFRDNAPRIVAIDPQAWTEAPIGLIKKDSTMDFETREETLRTGGQRGDSSVCGCVIGVCPASTVNRCIFFFACTSCTNTPTLLRTTEYLTHSDLKKKTELKRKMQLAKQRAKERETQVGSAGVV